MMPMNLASSRQATRRAAAFLLLARFRGPGGPLRGTSPVNIEYRPIPEWPGYRAGSDGTIWSCWKIVGIGYCMGVRYVLSDTWKQLRPRKQKTGYLMLSLRRDGKTFGMLVHRLVLLAFEGPPPVGMEACHGDGNRAHNSRDNLRWDTRSRNQNDKITHGTIARGERNSNAKLTAESVLEIRRLLGSKTATAIGRMFGVGINCIKSVENGKTWKWLKQ